MKIGVVGTGYVGLVTGTCLAESGNEVICVDNNLGKVEMLKSGEIPIYEPGLEDFFSRNIRENRLKFTSNLGDISEVELVFFCLPTPPMEDGSADLKYVMEVSQNLVEYIRDGTVVINKSTVPVGTTARIREIFGSLSAKKIQVISNPEFLREGTAVQDFMEPERIVIGTNSEKVKAKMLDLYNPFVKDLNQIIFMDEKSSELTKYAANSFLATKISFMNEIANLCEKLGANVDLVEKGLATDSRIGSKFLKAGIGYGGSCFPKDVAALNFIAKANDYNFQILQSVSQVNESQKKKMVQKVQKKFSDLNNLKLAVWGLAFKPNTDDIREAPSLDIIKELLDLGAKVQAYDPIANSNFHKFSGLNISLFDNQYEVLDQCEALLILTDWQEFKTPDFQKVKKLLNKPIIFDGRNLYELEKMRENGFYYESVGRSVIL